MKNSVLLELPYLPPVSWMALAWKGDTLWLEACENFQKGSYRNRCHIAGPNGVQRLSIPLIKGKHQQTPIRDVRIAYNEPWQQVHWRSIQTAYGNAPFFEFYGETLAVFYQKRYTYLFDLNLELLQFLFKKMEWKGELRLTEQYEEKIRRPGSCLDYRDAVSPKNAIRSDWFRPAPYPQVFAERHGFLPDLSALDLLFCRGKQAGEILAGSLADHLISTSTNAGSPS
ncbi:MAG: WbqC family protein [Thermoanaerobaculia bacterium]|nr:WbqC family protein [Thermoanaerobaculia bacterium]